MISNEPTRTLPHREPFLWVTRLMERNEEGTSGLVELDVNAENEVFKGHFPGNPIFPGVLQMEAAAQACLWVYLGVLPEGSNMPEVLFVSADPYKFRKPVVPPTTLRIKVYRERMRSALQQWAAEVSIGDTRVSEGKFWLRMVSPEFQPGVFR